jgi:hypothetical protein
MTPREQVITRAGGSCERCRQTLRGSWSIHHRLPRGMGGTKTPDDAYRLVMLCGSGVTGCHGWVESNRAEATEQGWLIRHGVTKPVDVPVFADGAWYAVTPHALVPLTVVPAHACRAPLAPTPTPASKESADARCPF